jgi:hypothetical protein
MGAGAHERRGESAQGPIGAEAHERMGAEARGAPDVDAVMSSHKTPHRAIRFESSGCPPCAHAPMRLCAYLPFPGSAGTFASLLGFGISVGLVFFSAGRHGFSTSVSGW